MRNLLGGKGANLAEMASFGLPVPPGFTITTEVCNAYYGATAATTRTVLRAEVEAALAAVELAIGARFGDPRRSAAGLGALRRPRLHARHDGHGAQSGPQRRDRRAMARQASGDERFAYDSYRRFIQMYGDVVLGVDHGITSRTSWTDHKDTASASASTPI